MRTRRHSEDVASESYTARVDDANGTITREKKHLTQICVHKIGGSTQNMFDKYDQGKATAESRICHRSESQSPFFPTI